MKINFSKPVIMLGANEFKIYCKKGSMKDMFNALRGDVDF